MQRKNACPCCACYAKKQKGMKNNAECNTIYRWRGERKPGRAGRIQKAVLQFVDSQGNLHEREFSAGYIRTTNNRMELMAVIAGLEALTKPCRVEIVSDSKYVTDAFNKKWIDGWLKKNWKGASGPVKNVDLWKRLLAAAQPHELHFTWVKGHAGHPENERCDHLATTAADTNAVLTDPGVHG